MTMAGDVLPAAKITEGISRFAFTVSIGMAVGPFVGLKVQSNMNSKASFLTIFGITVAALLCVSCCRLKYPKVERKKFSLKESLYGPAAPFMLNMMFLMIPYGAVIAYSSILAQEKNIMEYLPYFYICLVVGMLLSKTSTQKVIDAGKHRPLVYASLVVLILTMISFLFLTTGAHLLAAGFFFGLGYGILQPLFQSFVTGTTPAPQRGVANSTYMLSYDIGIGIGSLLKRTLPRRRKNSGRRDAHPPVGGASGFAHADRVPKLAQSPDDQGRRAEFSPAGFRMGMEIAPPRRQLWEHSGKRAMQKRQRGNRHRRYLTGTSRPPNGYNKKW